MENNIIYNKKTYPHLYESERLGGPLSREGSRYVRKFMFEIRDEYNKFLDEYELRVKNGGNYGIHKPNMYGKEKNL